MLIHSTRLPSVDLLLGAGDIFGFQSARVRYQRLVAVAVLMSTIWVSAGQSASAKATNMFAASPSGAADQKTAQIIIPVSLEIALDSKKRSTGDAVEAKTSAAVHLTDGTLIPRGAKVMGRITEAKSRSKGDAESSLGIVFDKIATPGGGTVNIKAYLRAVAPNPNAGESDGGVGYAGLNQTVEHSQPGDQSQPTPILTTQSEGVEGIKNLTLGSDGVLRSQAKTVKLDRGSQMTLRAEVVSAQ